MNMLLASLIFIALFAVSLAHFVWALGLSWPIRNQKLVAQTVMGFKNVERMPRLASLAVSVATFVAACYALALADHDGGGLPLSLIGLGLAAIFLARGIIGYTPWWTAVTPEPSFRFNDRRVYSPLCLFLGAGFLILVILRFL